MKEGEEGVATEKDTVPFSRLFDLQLWLPSLLRLSAASAHKRLVAAAVFGRRRYTRARGSSPWRGRISLFCEDYARKVWQACTK